MEYQKNECKRQPSFVKTVGFNPNASAISTSDKKITGLVLLEQTADGEIKKYQHPSWQMGGWMGPVQLDPNGNCFVGPVPVINILNNPPQNKILFIK
ncbi:MAG: hypothetical protein K2X48_09490 [Chitinophagaceae bacterium]|nr:hypothetical protein [Chitinophagaceae bacterium]